MHLKYIIVGTVSFFSVHLSMYTHITLLYKRVYILHPHVRTYTSGSHHVHTWCYVHACVLCVDAKYHVVQ